MSNETPTNDTDLPLADELGVEETPAAAGGHDDSEPEQGEGASDSY